PADLADDPVVPQLLQRRGGAGGLLGGVTRLAHAGLVVLHQQQRREQGVDPLGPLGVALDVFGRRGALAAAAARPERLGQPLHRVTIVAGLIRGHGPYLELGGGSIPRGPTGRGCRRGSSRGTDQVPARPWTGISPVGSGFDSSGRASASAPRGLLGS